MGIQELVKRVQIAREALGGDPLVAIAGVQPTEGGVGAPAQHLQGAHGFGAAALVGDADGVIPGCEDLTSDLIHTAANVLHTALYVRGPVAMFLYEVGQFGIRIKVPSSCPLDDHLLHGPSCRVGVTVAVSGSEVECNS